MKSVQLIKSTSSPNLQNESFKSFNFIKLDNRLNSSKKQQKRKQQQDKNILNIYKKKLPNLQFAKQCDKIIDLYKDHYNVHRRFSVFYNHKSDIQNKQQEIETKNIQEHSVKNYKLPQQRSKSPHNLQTLNKNTIKNNQIFLPNKILKPIKPNHYINDKGIVKINQNIIRPLKLQLSTSRKHKLFQQAQNLFQKSSQFRVKSFQSILALTKQQSQFQKNHQLSTNTMLLRNPSVIQRQRRKNLKVKFRKNVLLIIQKIKLMKVTINDIITKNLFDNTTPYKFGDQIFHAVKQGDQPKVFRNIMQNRLSLFSIDTTGKTTLMWACIRGYDKIAQLLLSNGVEPHRKDINGKTALQFAIKFDSVFCAKCLFIYSHYLETGIQKLPMSNQMRKMVRIGISTHRFINKFKNINKKKQYFEQQYRYYFKQ